MPVWRALWVTDLLNLEEASATTFDHRLALPLLERALSLSASGRSGGRARKPQGFLNVASTIAPKAAPGIPPTVAEDRGLFQVGC
jgi:hypothetical protein